LYIKVRILGREIGNLFYVKFVQNENNPPSVDDYPKFFAYLCLVVDELQPSFDWQDSASDMTKSWATLTTSGHI
jgi:hypothetical protein